jgi:hypothetical protein
MYLYIISLETIFYVVVRLKIEPVTTRPKNQCMDDKATIPPVITSKVSPAVRYQ